MMHANFRALKDSTYEDKPVRRARGGRTGLVAAGNPDVLAEAEGNEPYAKGDERKKSRRTKRKTGGAVHRMAGGPVKTRADRRSRRKFADGGAADDSAPDYGDQYTNTKSGVFKSNVAAKAEDDATPVADFLRGTRAGYVAGVVNSHNRVMSKVQGSGAAYRKGGRTRGK
jgi:hypothetical protein